MLNPLSDIFGQMPGAWVLTPTVLLHLVDLLLDVCRHVARLSKAPDDLLLARRDCYIDAGVENLD